MSITSTLADLTTAFRLSDRTATWKRGRLVLVTWDQKNLSYVLVQVARKQVRVIDCAITPRDEPLPPFAQLRSILAKQNYQVDSLCLAVPRAQLEMLTVEVPQADEDELAALVQTEVDAQFGDGEQTVVSDFCLLDGYQYPNRTKTPPVESDVRESGPDSLADANPTAPSSTSAVAFALEQARLDRWKADADKCGFRLIGLTSRQLAPLASLQREASFRRNLTVLVAIYAGEVELSFILRNRLAQLRTFRYSGDSLESLGEQIQMEIQRTLSMVDFGDASGDAEMVILTRDHGFNSESDAQPSESDSNAASALVTEGAWAELLETLGAREVHLSQSSIVTTDPSISGTPEPALLGAATDLAAYQLTVDLLHPKKPVPPPNPVLRWSVIGGFAAVSLMIVGLLLWSDVRDLASQVEVAEQELQRAEEVASKLQEQADQARVVESWLQNQVDWLERLEELSTEFPIGQEANVRRLSASLDENAGIFDLSIQVSDPAQVATLENQLRSAGFAVTSEQISEQSGNSEYPWQFEATVAFSLESTSEEADEEMQFAIDANPILGASASGNEEKTNEPPSGNQATPASSPESSQDGPATFQNDPDSSTAVKGAAS